MKKHRITGLIGTLVLHVLVLVFLLLVAISKPKLQEEGGVPVMLGNMEVAQGNADPYTLTDVDILDEPQLPTEPTVPEPVPETPVESDMITQEDEPTIAVPKKEAPKPTTKTEKVQKKPVQKEPVKPKEKTEAEKKAEAERLAAEKKAAEQKAAAEAAAKRIAGAFGKGTQTGSKGTGATGSGIQGSPKGNSTEGQSSGVGGEGSWSLNGRSLGGELPMPIYNVQEEGKVVVTITVNPAGEVINTSINKQTNTGNIELRRAAEVAARKARFNAVDGVNNQTGTITYYFKLK
jgi:TonB family protein